MKILAEQVNKVTREIGNFSGHLTVEVVQSDAQEIKLFYDLWKKNGDAWVQELLEREGYDLVKNGR